ncbi:unnamed protein product [Caretta caretta]
MFATNISCGERREARSTETLATLRCKAAVANSNGYYLGVLEFFWPGLHWFSAGVLHLPLEEGGQGLKCLHTQVHVFRLQALKRLLYGAGSPPWSVLAHAFLRRFRGLQYDQQLL